MEEEIIKQIYIDLCNASKDKDIEVLNNLLSDDYILVHMTGINQSKEEYINSVLSGELIYYESIHEDILVDIKGNKAKVIGKTKTLASPYGMHKSWWRLRQVMKLEKIDGKWLIKKSVASSY